MPSQRRKPLRRVTQLTLHNAPGLERAREEVEGLREALILPRAGKIARKILVLSDLHMPFHIPEIIEEIVDLHSDADTLVLNGDILDCYGISTWAKEKYMALRAEYMMALEFLRSVSERFRKVYVVKGNHEYRLNRWVTQHVPSDLSWMIDKEILGRLARGDVPEDVEVQPEGRGRPRIEHKLVPAQSMPNVYYVGGEEPWWMKIGDCLFVHPYTYRATKMSTATLAAERMVANRVEFNCLILGHTHMVGEVVWMGRKLIESGALCHKLDYEKQGKLTFQPHCLGYAVVYQDKEGRTDLDKTRVIYLGTVVEDKTTEDAVYHAEKEIA